MYDYWVLGPLGLGTLGVYYEAAIEKTMSANPKP